MNIFYIFIRMHIIFLDQDKLIFPEEGQKLEEDESPEEFEFEDIEPDNENNSDMIKNNTMLN